MTGGPDNDPTAPEQAMFDGGTAVDEQSTAVMPADLGFDLPDDPVAANEILVKELLAARQESGEYLETMQRIAAEFDNFRKRADRDRSDMIQRATQHLLTNMLPTLDSFDAALAYEPQTPAEEKIIEGMRSTRATLLELLQAEGLEPIPAIGAPFDPALHEAVSGPNDPGEGDLVVSAELRRGYVLAGRVLRAALVTVEHSEEQSE